VIFKSLCEQLLDAGTQTVQIGVHNSLFYAERMQLIEDPFFGTGRYG
jgi:hypothetical protein